MEKDKKMFLERVIHMEKGSLKPENISKPIPNCERFVEDDFDSYVREKMPVANIEVFENHCVQCINCARRLIQARKTLIREREKVKAEQGYQWTMHLLDRIDQEKLANEPVKKDFSANIISIILTGIQEVLQVVQTTGDVLELVPIQSRRYHSKPISVGMDTQNKDNGGKNIINAQEYENQSAIQIVQEFEQPSISVQSTITREGTEYLRVVVSVYDKDVDDFISGLEIQIHQGPNLEHTTLSDLNGEASFLLSVAVEYKIDIIRDNTSIGRIHLEMQTPV